MRTPARAIPHVVQRWASRVRWLRWLDVVATSIIVWPFVALVLELTAVASAVVALMLVGGAALLPPLRVRWRPASGLVSLSVSRGLRTGDRDMVRLPGRWSMSSSPQRRRWRMVVARPDHESAEGLEIRRTRVIVLPYARTDYVTDPARQPGGASSTVQGAEAMPSDPDDGRSTEARSA